MKRQLIDNYDFTVQPDTRDYRGFFVQDSTYRLAGMTKTGWAQICLNETACYYVDPAKLSPIQLE